MRLVDPTKVGRGVSVICQLRMRSHAVEERAKFEAFVQTREEIAECFAMSGEWDYLVRVVVRDVADYERFLMRELLKHPTIATAASHFALSQVKYTTAAPSAPAGTRRAEVSVQVSARVASLAPSAASHHMRSRLPSKVPR